MFITTQQEITSLMPTTRWERPEELFGYLEEEERVALEPLLGTPLYQHLCEEYVRLRDTYVDITAATVKPTRKAKADPAVPYADVTERLDALQAGTRPYISPCVPVDDEEEDVTEHDMLTIRLIRICQQVEFYRMLAHKAGMLAVSFNDGGGMNRVYADGYDPAGDKEIDRMTKDAFMSAGRAVDSLLLLLEADAKDGKVFTELWKEADAFYLHKDLLFQTARVMSQYLDINGVRLAYVKLVPDIRHCQMTYVKPRIGASLLKAVLDYANDGTVPESDDSDAAAEAYKELTVMLRTALAFYVEGRRNELAPAREKLARRDSMTDAQQAMAMACQWIEENLDVLGQAAVGTPVYNAWNARMEQERKERESREKMACRRHMDSMEMGRRKLFTAFPATHRNNDYR